MTTTTIQRPALTEQDIRKAIEASATSTDALRWAISVVASTSCAAFTALSRDDAGDDARDSRWRDLRRSEARRLRELVTGAIDAAATRCEAIILEELTAAGVAFAAEYPDAPRAVSDERGVRSTWRPMS
ncbi:MAG: hypothetical protein H0V12_00885 [Chloroflexi bacterium]|nr:hypothetical protein [Chloroflexota bacterium]